MIKLKRLCNKPVLIPRKNSSWEQGAVFNCAAIFENGLVHLLYRATDRASKGLPYISRLGYAVSSDGLHFNRLEQPVLTTLGRQEARGVEDPRLVRFNDRFYMIYTGYSGEDYKICLAESSNLIHWERRGVVLNELNKDASLFPEKIGGRYALFHRRAPDIWIAFSEDLEHWVDHTAIMSPLPDSAWQAEKIGIAGPPIKTRFGWFLIYHGVSRERAYSLGAVLLDPNDPTRVLERQGEPILAPELDWEVHGHVPRVVFSCGQAELGDRILVYYGGADTVIGVAELSRSEIHFS